MLAMSANLLTAFAFFEMTMCVYITSLDRRAGNIDLYRLLIMQDDINRL
jgi:hypothetical protein